MEFLDFDFVSGDLKASIEGDARRGAGALTRGRWKPIRYVAAEGLAVCAADDSLGVWAGWIPAWNLRAILRQPCVRDLPGGVGALDPALVIKVIAIGTPAASELKSHGSLSGPFPIDR